MAMCKKATMIEDENPVSRFQKENVENRKKCKSDPAV